jgi:hypothetical protein
MFSTGQIYWFFNFHRTALFNQSLNERIILLTFEKQIPKK